MDAQTHSLGMETHLEALKEQPFLLLASVELPVVVLHRFAAERMESAVRFEKKTRRNFARARAALERATSIRLTHGVDVIAIALERERVAAERRADVDRDDDVALDGLRRRRRSSVVVAD